VHRPLLIAREEMTILGVSTGTLQPLTN